VAAERLLHRFQHVRRSGRGWSALCPAHDDRENSLSIGEEDGNILIKCHTGCETEDVLRSVGLSFKDVMPERDEGPDGWAPGHPSQPRIVATYVYTDEGGEPIFRVVRYDNKKFSQERWTKNGKWAKGIKDVRRVPYRMHDIARAPKDSLIFIPEGEKDCDNLVKLGFLATTNQGGASSWRQIADEARVLLKGRSVVILPDNDGPGHQHGEDIAASLVGAAASIQVLDLPGLKPKGDVSDWIAAGGTADELRALAAAAPLFTTDKATDRFKAELDDLLAGTDKASADLFLAEHHEDVRFVHDWKKWLVWDGRHWRPDGDGEVKRRAKSVLNVLIEEVKRTHRATERDKLLNWIRALSKAARLDALLEWARTDENVTAAPNDFDAEPYLLNCANGTLDLRTGKLRGFKRTDGLTKYIKTAYDGDAEAPTWRGFIQRVLPDPDLQAFVQRAIGYSLTGDIGEQCMFILHGSGANGKSTLVETLRDLLGDYARATEQSTFLSRNDTNVRNDLAMLRGSRLVTSSETEDGKRLAESLVKLATGGEPIVARFLYGEHFEFRPEFKLWLGTNHRPMIKGTDEGIWRRIRLIPFAVTIPKGERDSAMPQKLRAELPGILRWAVEGCLMWQRDGLGSAGAVENATREYRIDQDIIGAWFDESCDLDEYGKHTPGALYESYSEWCKREREEAINQKQFASALQERGLKAGKSHGRRFWYGCSLRGAGGTRVSLFSESVSRENNKEKVIGKSTTLPPPAPRDEPPLCEPDELTLAIEGATGVGSSHNWTLDPDQEDA